jgi:RimJ/RimL family protein N-acetyltransferase
MQKVGMRPEGLLRGHIRKWDVFEDLAVYGILRDEFEPGA